jgi:hypothetical protein
MIPKLENFVPQSGVFRVTELRIKPAPVEFIKGEEIHRFSLIHLMISLDEPVS